MIESKLFYFQHSRKFAKCISKPFPDFLKLPEEDDHGRKFEVIGWTRPFLNWSTSQVLLTIDMLWNDQRIATPSLPRDISVPLSLNVALFNVSKLRDECEVLVATCD